MSLSIFIEEEMGKKKRKRTIEETKEKEKEERKTTIEEKVAEFWGKLWCHIASI